MFTSDGSVISDTLVCVAVPEPDATGAAATAACRFPSPPTVGDVWRAVGAAARRSWA